MKAPKALRQALGDVNESNWRDKLDALHDEHGSWKNVADQLGTNRRTMERWRYGYTDKRGNRRQVGPETIKKNLPKMKDLLGKSPSSQLAGVDWSKMRMRGTPRIGGNPEYEREESMDLGRYFDDEDFERIGQAYLDGNDAKVQEAFDRAMGSSYIGDGATTLTDVADLWF